MISVAFFAILFALLFALPMSQHSAQAGNIYDMLSDELVELYEREIAGCKVVTQYSAAQLDNMSKTLNVYEKKLEAVLLLQDLSVRVGENKGVGELAKMSDVALISYAGKIGKKYADTLSEERKEQLRSMLPPVASLLKAL